MELIMAFVLGASSVMIVDLLLAKKEERDSRLDERSRARAGHPSSTQLSWEDEGFCGCHRTWAEHEAFMTKGTTATPDTPWWPR